MPLPSDDSHPAKSVGVLCGLGAYLLWGIIPLYFKLLNYVAPSLTATLTLGHRIVWSVVFLAILLVLQRRWSDLRSILRNRRAMLLLGASTIMIAINWLVFIWAVGRNRVMEASLGYFINPLLSAALGLVFLHERFRRLQLLALTIAAIGVALLALNRGQLPWISLALAASFGFYGLLRKLAPVNPIAGLLVETVLLLPVGIAIIALALVDRSHPTGHAISWLLVALGITSSVPLVLFVIAARALRLSTIGFMQYVGPTCQFLLAVLVFGEPFGRTEIITFACIWLALAIYSFDSYRAFQQRDAASKARDPVALDSLRAGAPNQTEPLIDL